MIYPFLVFVHVLGAVGIAAAIGIEVLSLARLQRSETPADAHLWLGVLERMPGRVGGPAMLATIAAGIALMAMAWGRQPWISAAFVAIVAMVVAGGVVTARRTRRLRAALAAEAGRELSAEFRSLLSQGALAASLRLRVALAIGIVALMTLKPGAAGSSLVLAAAAAAGVVASAARRAWQAGASEA